jgi:NAD(P)-dependent dehydrogenase (short-subunit alcohol dehydrogenase family)
LSAAPASAGHVGRAGPSSRVVLVIGASSGIGRATVHRLAASGDHLLLAARAAGPLEDTAAECAGAASVRVLPLDIRDGPAVRAAVSEVVAHHGRLDAVVQSAGVVAYGRFEDIPQPVFDGVLATNVLGAANVARATLPVFRQQRRGTLVLLGSVLGQIGAPTMSPYVVSKWAVRALGRELALENRDLPDVRVSVLSPAGVDTPIYAQAATFLGRQGKPPPPVDSADKVARAVVRLLDHPRDRASVGLLNPLMRLGFSLAPRLFDPLVGPLFNRLALTHEGRAATAGNVLGPVSDRRGVTGEPAAR